jgi:hypothetical protein
VKILVLGGYGKVGIAAIKVLAKSKLVTNITIAGRNLKKAENTANNIGEKAEGIKIDGTNQQELTSILKGFDLVVNAAFDDTVLPTINAAILAKTNYCDANIGYIEQAKKLSLKAKETGITSIVANGVSPCISNITGEEITPQQWENDPLESIEFIKKFRAYFMWLMQTQQNEGLRILKHFKEKQWVESNPISSGVQIPQFDGSTIKAFPFISTEDIWGTLPRGLGKTLPVMTCFSPFPSKLHDALREQTLDMLEGIIDAERAVSNLYEIAESDPQHYLTMTNEFTHMPKMWVSAVGYKDEQPARSTCWLAAPMWNVGGYYLTSVVLALSAIKLLSGDINRKGVMTAEDAFDSNTFFGDLTAMLPEVEHKEKLVDEAIEFLD